MSEFSGIHGRFSVNLQLGNAAMLTPADVAIALRGVVGQLDRGIIDGKLHDVNGNRVGDWSYEAPQPDDEDDDDEALEQAYGGERDEPCVHGHFDCAEVEGGPCANETYARLLAEKPTEGGTA